MKFNLVTILLSTLLALSLNRVAVNCDEEYDETEDEEVVVDDEGTSMTGEDAEDEDLPLTSPDVNSTVLFVSPYTQLGHIPMLPAGKYAELVVGVLNKGDIDYVLSIIEGSFRYPQDFNYHIQNFSVIPLDITVKPGEEISLAYSFFPAEVFASRSFGLTINIHYQNLAGDHFRDAVFNETVPIIEVDEGLDTETFFLYIFLAALVVLLLVLGQQFLSSVARKKIGGGKKVEMGTSNPNDVDYDWIPKEALAKTTPKQSPRQRKIKRSE